MPFFHSLAPAFGLRWLLFNLKQFPFNAAGCYSDIVDVISSTPNSQCMTHMENNNGGYRGGSAFDSWYADVLSEQRLKLTTLDSLLFLSSATFIYTLYYVIINLLLYIFGLASLTVYL